MALFEKLKSIFKKPKKIEKPREKLKPEPKEKIGISQKPEIKKTVKPLIRKKYFREIYKILKEPHISEKATILAEENKYVFKVFPKANKTETKKAIESLYGVRVKDVNIVNVHRKRKIFRGIEGFKPGYKKAIVTLEKGEKIEIIPK